MEELGFIKENLETVTANIKEACKLANRNENEVTLIAVSKTKPVSYLKEAYEWGIRDFGENKVQEMNQKIPEMPNDIRWHMIGHLQTNKVKDVVGKAYLIHGVDSVKLAKEISKQSEKRGIISKILIEVNVAMEESKFGLSFDEVIAFVKEVSTLPCVEVHGLMTIAPYVDDPSKNKQYFEHLHKLFIDIRDQNIDNVYMEYLSMGMTNDYQVAIEEGSTYVRVGTGIFGERQYQI